MVSPQWVWRPWMESLTPSVPFRLIVNGSDVWYYRIDGTVFPQLTFDVQGI